MDRTQSADALRDLMRRDYEEFAAKCRNEDPGAFAVFTDAMKPRAAVAAAPASVKPTGDEAARSQNIFAGIPVGFGKAASGETKGWVALDRRDPDHFGESSFDGFDPRGDPVNAAILRARWSVPVWPAIQPPGAPVVANVQGRMALGQCVRIISWQTAPPKRPWAYVEPAACAAGQK